MLNRQFSFGGLSLLDSLRHFLATFRLPGESPVISRILELFSDQWLVIFIAVVEEFYIPVLLL